MIRGCFYHDGQECPRFAMSVLSERCFLIQQRGSNNIKQLYFRESLASATIGTKSSKAAYCSHMKGCSGSSCACHNAITHFLSQTEEASLDQYITKNRAYLEENISFPYILILVQQSEFVAITSFATGDFQATRLEPGLYDIRFGFSLFVSFPPVLIFAQCV